MQLQARDIEAAIPLWPQLAGSVPRIINYSENHTFRFDKAGGASYTLRVHRPDYQSIANIESELAWLAALRRDTGLPIPEPVAGRNGELLQGFLAPDGALRQAVLFRFLAGHEPSPDSGLLGLFGRLGNYAARMHEHATHWQRPAAFTRQSWSAGNILDSDGLWGDWRIAPGVTADIRSLLDRLDAALRRRLAAYGLGAGRYGLIHADMRLGNLLVDGDDVSLIDFDDCGFCWFTYDFAAAISFHETHATVPALKAAWLESYQAVRPLDKDDIASIDDMIMLRRMALLAWIGSHAETDLAQTHMAGFAAGTAELAEYYLGDAIGR
ncbi:phosphotransferase [Devosia sp. YIM 151766]|uniref:phosphotransferase enzyme family protein n=1 Tax=Devosia sp. YIM 151766 TaxID=3017325 RepID=UPI00255CEFD8|nr:phosphotransferase [Devosia sp. YIM 151766]WIY54029.1 phosphotransferase [Devosia sp. YIM 151766]